MARESLKTSFDKLIYLDSEFISTKYEEIRGITPSTEFTKIEGLRSQISIPVISSGIHTQETRKFKVSSLQMWKKINTELYKYPQLKITDFVNYQGTKIGWLDGKFSFGIWNEKVSNNSYENFELDSKGLRVALLTTPEYLSAGFSMLSTASIAIKSNIGIPVNILAKIMWFAENTQTYVACPYLIIEK
ncbi:hypothetical protein [Synechocystis sp. PCC 7338]|uniref:hypothetical protein n=1 Tax=Synechocystis sp. PCC 7338 TaxID=2732530 RepID=UPI001BB06E6E|nr:hypothetical protein [Synechocystis sp. PCC 7338]QUS61321.1 hypothetical protein HTZ78_12065 [Synechocystis sp. PCC 7338]